MGAVKPQEQKTRHESKEYKETRLQQESEKVVMTNDKGKIVPPKAWSILSAPQKAVFNRLKKFNPSYSFPDTNSLNRLAIAICEIENNSIELANYGPLDAEYQVIKKNIKDFDTMANYHEKMLGLPLAERYKAAADATKLIIEERKVAQMENQNKQSDIMELVANIMGDDVDEK